MTGFLMTVEIAEEFYKRCLEKEAITEKERIQIMLDLVKEQKVKQLNEEQIKNTINGKRVLHIKRSKRK